MTYSLTQSWGQMFICQYLLLPAEYGLGLSNYSSYFGYLIGFPHTSSSIMYHQLLEFLYYLKLEKDLYEILIPQNVISRKLLSKLHFNTIQVKRFNNPYIESPLETPVFLSYFFHIEISLL